VLLEAFSFAEIGLESVSALYSVVVREDFLDRLARALVYELCIQVGWDMGLTPLAWVKPTFS
jgi:hypothetical protein